VKLVSTTLTGNNEDIIGDALRSVVEWVDLCLVIDTGVTDRSLEVAREIAGSKLVVQKFPWVNDFAKARNFALMSAHALGADWAIAVDTDEGIHPNGEDLRKTLGSLTAGLLLMPDKGRNYTKERAIRVPTTSRYVGPTHESFVPDERGSAISERAFFSELPKTSEQLALKYERDVETLRAYSQLHPSDARWHYYLGESLKNLGRFDEAILAYQTCTDCNGWDEESAWACFRAAQCHEEKREWGKMVEVLSRGIGRHAGIAELPWYAGYACLKMGKNQQAIYWARLAITWGNFAGHGKMVKRIGFRFLPGLYEGPFDVLRFALKNVGETKLAEEAAKAFGAAKAARLQHLK
jgi:glycosyltransferase involved in cell wall biosynthesis